jgi:hypothetical protein
VVSFTLRPFYFGRGATITSRYKELQYFLVVRVLEYRKARTLCSEQHEDLRILDALAKLRKSTISFVMSVRLSFRMEQLGSH